MSEFSDHLSRLKSDRKINMYQLAQQLNIDRSTLYAIFNGTRNPARKDFVESLSVYLRLSLGETEQLQNELVLEQRGKNHLKCSENVEKILADYSVPSISDCEAVPEFGYTISADIPDLIILNKAEKLRRYLTVICDESLRRGENINIISQPDEFISSVLISCSDRCGKSRITHMICIDNSENCEINETYGISIFRYTLSVFADIPEYCPIYYYAPFSLSHDMMLAFPNCFIAGEYVVLFSANGTESMIIKNIAAVSMYRALFNEREKKCKQLFEVKKSIADLYSFYFSSESSEISFCFQPCITPCISREILHEVTQAPEPIKSIILSKILASFSKFSTSHEKTAISMFSRSGLTYFLNEGRINEVPPELYRPPTPLQRIEIIENAIDMCEKDVISYRAVRDMSIAPSERLVLSVLDEKRLIVSIKRKNGVIYCASVNEIGVSRAFAEYFEYIASSEKLYTKEETIEIMRAEVEQYRTSIAEKAKARAISEAT